MLLETKKKKNKSSRNESGIALLLSVIIVVSLMGVVVTVATITQRISRDNILIEASEVAFLTAESATEVALYEVIKNNTGVSLLDLQDQAFAINGATWDRDISVAISIPSRCDTQNPKPICTDVAGPVTSSNPLRINIGDNDSFQFDFNIVGATYPTSVNLAGDNLAESDLLLATGSEGQTNIQPGSTLNLDELGGADGSRVRLTNRAGGRVTYSLTPQGIQDLPLGINISTVGEYLGVERRIELTKPAWLIYR